MAKGSPLMGTQSGKLGESILYRAGGEQLQRAYVARPLNPRTSQQIYQRMFMATMGKALSAMHHIVDHSFENVKHGPKSMQFFMKRNIQMFRNNSSFNADLQAWVCPGMSFITPRWDYPTWNSYHISEGSLRPILRLNDYPLAGVPQAGELADVAVARRCVPWFFYMNPGEITDQNLAATTDFGIRFYGGKVGDFFTVCFYSARSEDTLGGAGVIYPCQFHYMRFQVVVWKTQFNELLCLVPSNIDGQNHIWAETYEGRGDLPAHPYIYNSHVWPYIDMSAKLMTEGEGSSLGQDDRFNYETPIHEGDVILSYCWIHSRPAGKKLLVSTQSMKYADNSGDVYERNLGIIEAYDAWLSQRKQVGDPSDVLDGGA